MQRNATQRSICRCKLHLHPQRLSTRKTQKKKSQETSRKRTPARTKSVVRNRRPNFSTLMRILSVPFSLPLSLWLQHHHHHYHCAGCCVEQTARFALFQPTITYARGVLRACAYIHTYTTRAPNPRISRSSRRT